VWEESEFWVALSWRIDPDGALGIRKHFESPYRPGERVTMDEYYGWMFEHSVPGLPEAAAAEQLTPLAYMRKYGVFKVKDHVYRPYEAPLAPEALARAQLDADEEIVRRDGAAIGVLVNGVAVSGFTTPSRRLEFYSPTLVDWGWPEHAVPRYVPGHVHWRNLDRARGEFDLLPNFRLPTLVHTRSPVKWLYEISHENPLWISSADARQYGIDTGDLVKVRTRIGYFVTRAWVTEGIRPGVLGMSHHLGRWRLHEEIGNRTASPCTQCPVDRSTGHRVQGVAGARRAAVRVGRPGHLAHLVERSRRPSELDVPGTAGSRQRDALLASARHARKGGTGGSLRRYLRRHREVARGVQRVARDDPAGARTGRPAAAAVVRSAAAACPGRLQTVGAAVSVIEALSPSRRGPSVFQIAPVGSSANQVTSPSSVTAAC